MNTFERSEATSVNTKILEILVLEIFNEFNKP